MKVAVTGASGFIGRHVLTELAKHPDLEIVAATRQSPLQIGGSILNVTFNIATISSNEAFDLLGQPDAVIHLAWDGLPNYRKLSHFEDSLVSQYRFLNGLVRSGLKRLTCTGTCFEYGMQAGELSEDLLTDPTNPYGFAKHALHRQLRFLKAEHPFELTWARLFYMYGAGQPQSSLFAQFIAAGLRGDELFKMSGGEQLRDFLPVERIAKYLVDLTLNASDAGTVNVCSGEAVSVRRLVEGWRSERDWSIKLQLGHYPYPDYEPFAFWGSAAKLRRLLSPVHSS